MTEKTGHGPDLVSRDWRTLGRNRGGQPRRDGTRADNSMTLREAGFSERDATSARRMARLSDEEFETALAKWGEEVPVIEKIAYRAFPDTIKIFLLCPPPMPPYRLSNTPEKIL